MKTHYRLVAYDGENGEMRYQIEDPHWNIVTKNLKPSEAYHVLATYNEHGLKEGKRKQFASKLEDVL